MADTEPVEPLRLWSLATFHTVSFMVLLAAGFHLKGSLAAVMKPLGTRTGIGAFAILWATTWWTTRVGLRLMKGAVEEVSATTVLLSAVTAGGCNGVAIWMVLAAGTAVRAVSQEGTLTRVPGLFLVSLVGSLFAFAVGAAIGLLFGVADALLLGAGATLFRATESGERASD